MDELVPFSCTLSLYINKVIITNTPYKYKHKEKESTDAFFLCYSVVLMMVLMVSVVMLPDVSETVMT
jgi:hypothetical protein